MEKNSSQVIKLNRWTRMVKNSVEDDILNELKDIIQEHPDWGWEQISIQDVYAYAMNQLPPIYFIKGSEPEFKLSKGELREAIKASMNKINQNPLHIRK